MVASNEYKGCQSRKALSWTTFTLYHPFGSIIIHHRPSRIRGWKLQCRHRSPPHPRTFCTSFGDLLCKWTYHPSPHDAMYNGWFEGTISSWPGLTLGMIYRRIINLLGLESHSAAEVNVMPSGYIENVYVCPLGSRFSRPMQELTASIFSPEGPRNCFHLPFPREPQQALRCGERGHGWIDLHTPVTGQLMEINKKLGKTSMLQRYLALQL